MKPPLRIGIFFLTIAISLFLAEFQRANSPITFGGGGNLKPYEWRDMISCLLGSQNLRISFSTVNGTLTSLYLLNPQGLQEWKDTGTINPIIRIENLSSNIGIYDIPSRDFYTIVVHNSNNATEGIHIDLTLYGFEKDLTLAIEIITIIAMAVPTICFISKKVTAHSHKKEV